MLLLHPSDTENNAGANGRCRGLLIFYKLGCIHINL